MVGSRKCPWLRRDEEMCGWIELCQQISFVIIRDRVMSPMNEPRLNAQKKKENWIDKETEILRKRNKKETAHYQSRTDHLVMSSSLLVTRYTA